MWQKIKFDRNVEIKAGKEYGIGIQGNSVIIKEVIGYDEIDNPIYAEKPVYESKEE